MTRQKVADALTVDDIDILHFVGHGKFENDRGYLRLNETEFDVDALELIACARYVMDRMKVHPQADLCLRLVDEPAMETLHVQWMELPGPTDVMSFPMDERTRLFLKPTFTEEDLAFKRRACRDIALLGDVVGAFENEPANANLFADEFPEAEVVLLETMCSPGAPPPYAKIARVPHFDRSR